MICWFLHPPLRKVRLLYAHFSATPLRTMLPRKLPCSSQGGGCNCRCRYVESRRQPLLEEHALYPAEQERSSTARGGGRVGWRVRRDCD